MKKFEDPMLVIYQLDCKDVIATSNDIPVTDTEIDDSNISGFGWRVSRRGDDME